MINRTFYRGDEIRKFLAEHLRDTESSKSSHWEKCLRDFSYSETAGVRGVKGFGSISRTGFITKLYHSLMQKPYKRHAKNFKDFKQIFSSAKEIAKKQKRAPDLDILRQALTVAFCKDKIVSLPNNKISVVIGDGFGVLSSLLLLNTGSKVVSVNLREVLLVDYIYTRGLIADNSTVLVETEADLEKALSEESVRLIYIQADRHVLLRSLAIDMVFNIASMQEMAPFIINEYFDDIRYCKSKSIYFYCCNRIEKVLPDGTITRFFDYPWQTGDEIIIDELCPWHQNYYTSRPPFYRSFLGPVQHRLVNINNVSHQL